MKYFKIFSLFILIALMATSCKKALDINTDPLVATSADPNAVLPFVFVQYSNRHTSELGTRMMDVPQHIAQCFNSPKAGATGSTITGNTWGMYYTQVLGNLALVEIDALAGGAGNNNIAAIAKIFKAKSFFELSSIWGDIPFTQALDGVQFPTPTFDTQEDVFRGVITILDEAITLIDAMPADVADVSTGDLIYNGDMDNWRRWANSLKLRVLMMLRNKDTSVDTEISKVLSEPMIEDNSQAALIRYADNSGEANSWQRLITNFFGGRNEEAGVYSPSAVSFDLLNQNDDPRFALMISDPNGNGPADIGLATFGAPGSTAHISNNVVRNDMPHNMFLPSEISFYRAELALLGVSSDDAQAEFEKGVRQICEYWGGAIPNATATIASADIDNFITNLGAVDLQKVHEQLYLESFFRPVIAWNTVRRTKVPTMLPVPGSSITTILKRFNYPPDEVSSNSNTPANAPTDTPMWFEN
ncbi:MAG: SusD/RagB family nutrient-binding outer membrane lipoprotein [Saprospiraceae bacterium]